MPTLHPNGPAVPPAPGVAGVAVGLPPCSFVLQSHIAPRLSLPKPVKGRIIHFIRRGVEQSGSSSGS